MSHNTRFYKDPDVQTYFTLDWGPDLRPGEALVSTTWTVDTGITKITEGTQGTVSTLWVSGGTLGGTYEAVCRATYDNDRTEDWTIRITCKER